MIWLLFADSGSVCSSAYFLPRLPSISGLAEMTPLLWVVWMASIPTTEGSLGCTTQLTFTCFSMILILFLLSTVLLQFTLNYVYIYQRHDAPLQQIEIGKSPAESGRAGHLFWLCQWLTVLLWEKYLASLAPRFLICKDQKDPTRPQHFWFSAEVSFHIAWWMICLSCHLNKC